MASARSIADHLLEDYNSKLGLNISLDDKLYPNKFEKEAQRKNNTSALRFIEFYKKEFDKLEKDTIGKLLLSKRNIKIHRKEINVRGEFSRSLTEEVKIGDSLSVVVIDKDGNIKKQSATTTTRQEDQKEDNNLLHKTDAKKVHGTEPAKLEAKDSVRWYFDDYNDKEVSDTCDHFLNLMKDFVRKVQARFP